MNEPKNEKKWHLLKTDKDIQVYRASLDDHRDVLVKQYRLHSWYGRLSFGLKVKRLAALYQQGFTFIPAMLHVGMRDQGRLGQVCYEFIVGQDLRSIDWVAVSVAQQQQMGEAIGQLLAELHNAGWAHGDCKFGNFMYVPTAPASPLAPDSNSSNSSGNSLSNSPGNNPIKSCIKLVDIESARRPVLQRQKTQARDIARLLLNVLEKKARTEFAETIWQQYLTELNNKPSTKFTADVKQWLNLLAERHKAKYGSDVDASRLMFL